LIHRDEINVTYILKLLANLKTANPSEKEKQKKKAEKKILDTLAGEENLDEEKI
jgi:type I restriction enzyme R subunit